MLFSDKTFILIFMIVATISLIVIYYIFIKKMIKFFKNKRIKNKENNVKPLNIKPYLAVLVLGFYPLYFLLYEILGVTMENTQSILFYVVFSIGFFTLFTSLVIELGLVYDETHEVSFLTVIISYILGVGYMTHLLA